MPFQSYGHVGWMAQRFPQSHCSQEVPKHTKIHKWTMEARIIWQLMTCSSSCYRSLNIQEYLAKDFVGDVTNLNLFLYLLANIWHVWLQHHWQKANNICAETNYSTSTVPVINAYATARRMISSDTIAMMYHLSIQSIM